MDITELRDICIQFNLPVEKELLEALFEYCDVNNDGQIDYSEFSNFLNWKDKMPVGISSILKRKEEDGEAGQKNEEQESNEIDNKSTNEESPKQLRKQIDEAVVDYKTSSKTIGAVVGGVATTGK